MNIDRIEALWYLGKLEPETIPDVAAELLGKDFDGPAMRALAAMTKPTLREICSLDVLLQEIGRTPLTKPEAAMQLAKIIARDIIEEKTPPYEGARFIWTQIWNDNRDLDRLAVFAGLADGYEDEANNRMKYVQDIIEAARN